MEHERVSRTDAALQGAGERSDRIALSCCAIAVMMFELI
jgi:hypothetical protein